MAKLKLMVCVNFFLGIAAGAAAVAIDVGAFGGGAFFFVLVNTV